MKSHRVFVHIPAVMLGEHRHSLESLAPGLEILIDHDALDPAFRSRLEEAASWIRAAGKPCRFHGPFRDLSPGGHDPLALELARSRLIAAMDLAPLFDAEVMVVHSGWDPRDYALEREPWIERSLNFWRALAPEAEKRGVHLALENVRDFSPELLAGLLAELPADRFSVTFDTGHWNAWSKESPLADWFTALGPRMTSFHLHDNSGKVDDHGPVGGGSFPWRDFFALARRQPRPADWTLENRSPEDIVRSLRYLAEFSGIDVFRDFLDYPELRNGGKY